MDFNVLCHNFLPVLCVIWMMEQVSRVSTQTQTASFGKCSFQSFRVRICPLLECSQIRRLFQKDTFSSHFLSSHILCGIAVDTGRKGTGLSSVSLENGLDHTKILSNLHYKKRTYLHLENSSMCGVKLGDHWGWYYDDPLESNMYNKVWSGSEI